MSSWVRKTLGAESRNTDKEAIEGAIQLALPRSEERFGKAAPIGRGGMAVVEGVVDLAIRRRVARKVLRPKSEGKLSAVKALVSEAQITGQLDHPNIVPVYDFGKDDDGRLFFTMKLLRGLTLAKVVSDLSVAPMGRSTLLDLLEVVNRVCDALAFAHQRGVVHGDLKPQNVMVARYGQVYLVDWGLARTSDREPIGRKDSEMVATTFQQDWGRNVVGTPGYLAPEQTTTGAVDERTDVFGVGAMLYFILTRAAPYANGTLSEILRKAKKCEYPPLDEATVGFVPPRELARIAKRAMAEVPENRYQTIVDLQRDLVTFVRGGKLPTAHFNAGQHVVREGEVGQDAYIIVSGRCEVRKTVGDAEERIRVLEAGDCFGETAILAASPRTASVVAMEDVVVECISGEELVDDIDSMKPWMGKLLRTLAERFRERETDSRD